MKTYLVTVKFPKQPGHNPQNKQTGPCPANGLPCTDATGQHHTIIIPANDIEEARTIAGWNYAHITRIEEAE